ncbi:endonuclease/exonuclease/phosphatase family protein [Desulfuromonas thiophila]|uniref:Endonuclease/Exonuclease/phosphatase family protein n=1 Tax=Desulfuromonas thiophila TaxID=57664 RepID=A0A1G7E6M8_9BACT|nr:endonuclease/exonuclease/phosphatase family protein [Desulfuromonas thiophila]SDE59150.1 hypothetical protein SAMN05661003_1188 [Desulfuromonas thiophila]
MRNLRLLSFNLKGLRDSASFFSWIRSQQVDIVALQYADLVSLDELVFYTGFSQIRVGQRSGLALLASVPIFQQVQEFDLGAGASCQVADVRFSIYRFLLVNLRLCGGFWFRPQQLHRLFGPDIFQRSHLALPCILVGDFFDGIWLSMFNPFQQNLKRVAPFWCRATYPACFPLIARDRIYKMNGILVNQVEILYCIRERFLCSHLPLFLNFTLSQDFISLPVGLKLFDKFKSVPGNTFMNLRSVDNFYVGS